MAIKNAALELAIQKLGGPTQVTFQLRCSLPTVQRWRALGRIPRPVMAQRLSKLTDVALVDLLGDLDGDKISQTN